METIIMTRIHGSAKIDDLSLDYKLDRILDPHEGTALASDTSVPITELANMLSEAFERIKELQGEEGNVAREEI